MNEQSTKSSPWDVFIHLLAMVAVFASIYAAISLLLDYVTLAFPEADDLRFRIRSDIRYCAALLIVFFPAYCWAWRSIESDLSRNPGKKTLWVRTCPIYLTLFVAGVLALGDLACLTYYFLNGELTARFLLKVLSILLVTGPVLYFYRSALREEPGSPTPLVRLVGYGGASFVAVLIIAAVAITGSPKQARLENLDDQRAHDLGNIQKEILTYWENKGELPASLDALQDSMTGYVPPRDPQTKKPYIYKITGATSFELCAEFDLKNSEAMADGQWDAVYRKLSNHGAGLACFPWNIDPTRHRPKTSSSS
jgi:hypothetical protein